MTPLLTAIHQDDEWRVELEPEGDGDVGRGLGIGLLLALVFWLGLAWFLVKCVRGTI